MGKKRISLLILYNIVLEDKHRPAAYYFTLDDFRSRIANYLPDGDTEKISHLQDLPHGHDLQEAPEEDRPPAFYEMEFDGSMFGIKRQKKYSIIITARCYDILCKYRYVSCSIYICL